MNLKLKFKKNPIEVKCRVSACALKFSEAKHR